MFSALRHFLLISFALFVSVNSAIADDLDTPFPPQWMSPEEARFLQTGLTLEGLYVGLIDGKWGSGSQAALDKFMAGRLKGRQLTYGDLRPLVQRTQQAIQTDFWQGINDFPDRATFLAPMAILQQDKSSDLFTLQTTDNSLKIRLIDNDKDKTIEMHQWLIDNHKGTKPELYQKYTDKRLVTSGKLKSGKTVYLRSEYAKSGVIVTVLVQYEPWQKDRGALIAASINYEGWGIRLGIPTNSPLTRLLGGGDGSTSRPSKPVTPATGGSGGISRSQPGTGSQPAQPSSGGIARSQPGSGGTPVTGTGGSGGSSGGISRPVTGVAANSMSFSIPPVPAPAQ